MEAKKYIASETMRVMEALFRSARSMPEDKLTWQPGDLGRTALDQLQECAMVPSWAASLLTTRKFDFTPEMMKAAAEERSKWTLDDCERECRERTEKLFEVMDAFPDEDLEKTMFLPFGGGKDRPFAEIMGLHLWNLTYHLGQIGYIQLMYGDKEMH